MVERLYRNTFGRNRVFLLDAGVDINAQTDEMETPVFGVVQHNEVETVAALIGRGARTDIRYF